MHKNIVQSWHPDRPVSKGATAYHDAVINSSWLKDILFEFSKIVKPDIKENEIIVDFGAGTGTSAFYLMKNLGKKVRLWLVDNSPSWLLKNHQNFLGGGGIRGFFPLEKREKN